MPATIFPCAVCGAAMDFERYVNLAYCGKACRTLWRRWDKQAERAKARPSTQYPDGVESDVPVEQEDPDGLC